MSALITLRFLLLTQSFITINPLTTLYYIALSWSGEFLLVLCSNLTCLCTYEKNTVHAIRLGLSTEINRFWDVLFTSPCAVYYKLIIQTFRSLCRLCYIINILRSASEYTHIDRRVVIQCFCVSFICGQTIYLLYIICSHTSHDNNINFTIQPLHRIGKHISISAITTHIINMKRKEIVIFQRRIFLMRTARFNVLVKSCTQRTAAKRELTIIQSSDGLLVRFIHMCLYLVGSASSYVEDSFASHKFNI